MLVKELITKIAPASPEDPRRTEEDPRRTEEDPRREKTPPPPKMDVGRRPPRGGAFLKANTHPPAEDGCRGGAEDGCREKPAEGGRFSKSENTHPPPAANSNKIFQHPVFFICV